MQPLPKKDNSEFLAVRRQVMAWPGIGGDQKLVFLYLLEVAGGVNRPAVCHPRNIAVLLGRSEKSSHRYLDRLADYGLIEIRNRDSHRQRRAGGDWTLFLKDPREVARMRLMPGESAEQPELDFWSDSQSPTEEPEEKADIISWDERSPSAEISAERSAVLTPELRTSPSAEVRTSGNAEVRSLDARTADLRSPAQTFAESGETRSAVLGSELRSAPLRPLEVLRPLGLNTRAHRTLDFKTLKGNAENADLRRMQASQENQRRADDRQADEERGRLAGSVGAVISRLPSPRERETWVNQKADLILAAVADPTFYRGIALKFAWEMVNGLIDENDLESILRPMRSTLAIEPGRSAAKYFNLAMRRMWERRGIPWERKRHGQ